MEMSRIIKDLWGRILSPLIVGEKELLKRLTMHLQLSQRALEILEGMVLSAVENNSISKAKVSEGMREIAALEREGDEIVRQANYELLKGAIPATTVPIADAILNKSDDILDGIHILSRELKRTYTLCGTEHVREFLSEEFLEMIRIGKEALKNLLEIVSSLDTRSFSDIRVMVMGIQKLEEEVDDIKDSALDKLYSNARELTYIEFFSIMSLIFEMDDVLDSIKDIAHMLLTLISTYGT
jgi:predicted phosphate transport protein (TIGR00153 family)